ncbi:MULTISPECIES: hypothetical protein [Clostridium]|uniref:VanZ family protein n=1 Tax=Clostridium sporogenes TaxID=1509 RepID=A0AAE6I9Z9_CLOSG|nr:MULTISPECIES: hypothetical protein [Clostridium]APQ78636.1 putative membrane protein [Clostridium botulinum]MBN3355980.1 hypothetical protein [Clostridium botulinum]QDY34673.1 hypothetical protein CGS26_20490 [Clostridium sporogenes]
MNHKVINIIKAVGLLLFVIVITFINDNYIRVYYYMYTNELRLLDHLLVGVSIPLILYLLLGKFYRRCTFYLIWSSYWEISQYIKRGYFQYNQYIFDLIGMAIAIYLYSHNFVVRKES